MILNFGAGKAKDKAPPVFTVTGGTYSYAEETAQDGTVNWEIALLSGSNAVLNFGRVVDYVDVFLVGGGQSAVGQGGRGGYGGACVTCSGETKIPVSGNTNYPFTVGGSGGDTTIFDRTASSGGGSAGGVGGINCTEGSDGVYAFSNAASLLYSGRKYGAGGGGGGYNHRRQGYVPGAGGGETGGGTGGMNLSTGGTDGEANTGGGGGGLYWDDYTYVASSAGAGGSGIIIIRNAR